MVRHQSGRSGVNRSVPLEGKRQRERGSSRAALHADAAAMRPHDGADDGQAQAGAAFAAATPGVAAPEAVEDPLQVFGRNRVALVRDRQDDPSGRRSDGDLDA